MATIVAASVLLTPLGTDVPTIYKAQLDHVGFDWTKDADLILRSLMAQKNLILAKAGFGGVRGCIYNPTTHTIQTERSSFNPSPGRVFRSIGGAAARAIGGSG
jgi:hypothetical protein